MAMLYALPVWVAAHTAALAALLGATGTPVLRIRTVAEEVVAEVPLSIATSMVDPDTGAITLTPANPSTAAIADGIAHHADIYTGANEHRGRLPCVEGTIAQAGYCVLAFTAISTGALIVPQTMIIPAGTLL